MQKDSILKYNIEKGFGEAIWYICPSCWNWMKVTRWEDGTEEESCPACKRMETEAAKE
jgi:rubrerythrin